MKIQWYPGHMHKAGKEMKQALPKVDLIIEILDARIPFSSENPMIASIRGDKPCIKLFNKSDLADPEMTAVWQQWFEQKRQVKTLAISLQETDKIKKIPDLCRKMVANKSRSGKTILAMIMGIPNVGKSTLINTLLGRTVAKTGNEPAVTKGQQRIQLAEDIVLLDTPGMLWPNVENRNSGYRLATTGAVKDTAIEHDDIAFFAAEYLLAEYPQRLLQRFNLDGIPQSAYELLEAIGRQRGCLRGGGTVELDKVSKIFLGEIRAGVLGGLTFETPQMMQEELVEVEAERLQKEEKKATRKQKRKR